MLTPSGHTRTQIGKERERETEADAYRELGLFAGRSTAHFLPLFYVAWRLCERALVCMFTPAWSALLQLVFSLRVASQKAIRGKCWCGPVPGTVRTFQ